MVDDVFIGGERDISVGKQELMKSEGTDEYKLVLDDDSHQLLNSMSDDHGLSRSVLVRVSIKIFNELLSSQPDLIDQLVDIPDGNEQIRRVL